MSPNPCVFCQIVDGKLPAQVVWADAFWMAIRDIAPQAPVHVVLFPRAHIERLVPHRLATPDSLLTFASAVITQAAAAVGLEDYRIALNNGRGAGQEVPHLHVHLLGGWPAGDVPPLVPPMSPTFSALEMTVLRSVVSDFAIRGLVERYREGSAGTGTCDGSDAWLKLSSDERQRFIAKLDAVPGFGPLFRSAP